MLNKCILHGRLVDLPTYKETVDQKPHAKFTLAVPRESDPEIVDFIPCAIWGRRARVLCNYIHKGEAIVVEGKLHIHEWYNDQAERQKDFEVEVYTFDFMCNKKGLDYIDFGPKEEGDYDVYKAPPIDLFNLQNKEEQSDIDTLEDLPF